MGKSHDDEPHDEPDDDGRHDEPGHDDEPATAAAAAGRLIQF